MNDRLLHPSGARPATAVGVPPAADGTVLRRRGRRLVAGTLAAALAVVGLAPVASAAPAAPATAATDDADQDLASLVDVFVGTEGDFGNDMPAAQAPNGLAKVNPRTMPGRNNTGYDYAQPQISGFTHTNLDAVGGSGAGGDILVVPTSGSYTARPGTSTYAHAFSHDDEDAGPGYYSVGLGNIAGSDGSIEAAGGTIDAEVAATTRSGVHRYDFPEGSTPSLVLDLSTNNTSRIASSLDVTTLDDGRTAISGSFTGHFYNADYQMYYYATTTQPVADVQTWGDDKALTDATAQDGRDTGAILTFDADDADDVGLEVTLSPVSAAQAKVDQANELGDLGFDAIRERTRAEWNAQLGKVEVSASVATDPTGDLKKLFYTHLYRMFAMPMNATSTSGTYRGVDGVVHRAQGFTYYDSWTTWDDFRKFSVIAYIDPETYRDMIQSLIYLYADAEAEGSGSSIGDLLHTVPTVRWERSAVVVADAIGKGYTGFDRLDEAYPALERLVGGYSDADRERGYLPGNPGSSVQLGYDQWALSIIADELGRTDDAQSLRDQAALPIENLIKPGAWTADDGTEVGVLMPRAADGSWQDADLEKFETARLYQGTLWQYNWYDAYDMAGLMDAMGGTEAARLAMRHMFGEDSDVDDGSGMLHSNANEIDLQAPYLFNYVGEPALTQKWTRAIYTKETWNRYIGTGSTSFFPSGGGEFTPPIKTHVYKLDPRGMLATMDNDAGTMSTMFVAAAIGLFPVTAGSDEYQIGSPIFDTATIRHDDGTSFQVTAEGVSEDDFYIQSATLDGADLDNTWVDYAAVVGDGDLTFAMGAQPSDWGTDTEPAYSMSTDDGDDDTRYPVSAEPSTVQAGADGAVDGSVTLTLGGGAALAAEPGTELVASGDASVEGLPDGVDATVTVASGSTLTVALSGTAADEARFYVRLRDSALADGVAASSLGGDGVSLRSPLRLSVAGTERAELADLVADATPVRKGNYSSVSFTRFSAALDRAQDLLADDASSSVDLRFAADRLSAAIDALDITGGGYRILEGEKSEEWSGGELSNEANSSAGNLGGVRSGSWIQYGDMTFDDAAQPGYLTVDYATSFGSGDAPSTLVVHGGDVDGPVVATTDLTGTGGWGNYRELTVALDDAQALADAGTVTFEFITVAGRDWVGNFDRFRFSEDDPAETEDPDATAAVTVESEDWTATSGGGLKKESSTWASGPVTNVGGTADGDWLAYGEVDLGELPLGELSVHYVHNSGRCGADSALEVYLDEFDPENPGEPFATVPLATTGSSWTADGTATVALPETVSGTHEVFVRLTTQADAAHPYVANLDSMTFAPGGPTDVLVESEAWTENSGGGLKNESSTWDSGAVTNVGGTADGDWLAYGEVDLGSAALGQLSVHYVHNSGRCGNDSALEVYLDEFDPQDPGDPFARVPLPSTGSGWSNDGVATIELPSTVRGTHEVFVRLTTEAYANHPYVANLDSMTFFTDAYDVEVPETDTAALAAVVTDVEHLADEADRYNRIDFGVFTRELAAARALLGADDATQEQVDEQTRRLTLAAEQLVPVPDVELVEVTVSPRCLAGKAYVAVRATNVSDAAVDVELASALGTRSYDGVEPGANAYQSFAARSVTGDLDVTVTATGAEGEQTVEQTVTVSSCS
ncbi:glycoside hydrolase domain-containing protein [Cellulosimicrobium arenosum]|uniref:Glycoside hydrolase family 92 protein n=1 Tax=Cellulosimicrobium arenosum TaxID=2708133 RepID=A0A927J2H4_9MICO|nr:glycoside hydrolase domain-containing protein [Cellulosimicrobium arenosum]MBD8080425.1 glycoside hydrolase family 92 protein [Cellulosimicrobium arenosum]